MLAQHFEMISNAYDLIRQSLDGKFLRVLLPTLPCYSSVASMASSLYTFPPMWDMPARKGPSWHLGIKLLNTENLIFDK